MASPFQFAVENAQRAGQSIGGAFRKQQDTSAIQEILQRARRSDTPTNYYDAMADILAKVSPQAQQTPIALLQAMQQNQELQEKKALEQATQKRKQTAAEKFGLDSDLPPAVQAQILKNNEKQRFMKQFDSPGQPTQGMMPPPSPSMSTQPTSQKTYPTPFGNLTKDQITQLTGAPYKEVSEPAKAILKQIEEVEERGHKEKIENRKEVLPLYNEIIDQGEDALQSILNKEDQLQLIDKGDLNDPTFVTFLDSLPGKLGTRWLSPDSVSYRAAQIEDYKDLRTTFKGATRVKEIELFENKIPDLYYTDAQKRQILKARINTQQYYVAKAQAAQQVLDENPGIDGPNFRRKVNDLTKKKQNEILNEYLDKQKEVNREAESIKNQRLDAANPKHKEVIQQLIREAGNDVKKAEVLARKKGYKF